MLVVGSKALKYRFPAIDRKVGDVDAIAHRVEVDRLVADLDPAHVDHGDGIISLRGIRRKNEVFDRDNAEFLLADGCRPLSMYMSYHKMANGEELFASADILYSLKKSHIHFPVKFHKHIGDFLLLDAHFKGHDRLSEITRLNFKETESRLGRLRTPKLNKSVDKFFGQSRSRVVSYFVHDDMHRAVAHYDEPLYLRMQRDRTMAMCDRDLWELFSHQDKCRCVLEEAYVIALERRVLPAIYGDAPTWVTASEAIDWALMRICTTLCSGWFREFATRNYGVIRQMASPSYVEDFLSKVDSGKIARCEVR
jgi:hypothetical protein